MQIRDGKHTSKNFNKTTLYGHDAEIKIQDMQSNIVKLEIMSSALQKEFDEAIDKERESVSADYGVMINDIKKAIEKCKSEIEMLSTKAPWVHVFKTICKKDSVHTKARDTMYQTDIDITGDLATRPYQVNYYTESENHMLLSDLRFETVLENKVDIIMSKLYQSDKATIQKVLEANDCSTLKDLKELLEYKIEKIMLAVVNETENDYFEDKAFLGGIGHSLLEMSIQELSEKVSATLKNRVPAETKDDSVEKARAEAKKISDAADAKLSSNKAPEQKPEVTTVAQEAKPVDGGEPAKVSEPNPETKVSTSEKTDATKPVESPKSPDMTKPVVPVSTPTVEPVVAKDTTSLKPIKKKIGDSKPIPASEPIISEDKVAAMGIVGIYAYLKTKQERYNKIVGKFKAAKASGNNDLISAYMSKLKTIKHSLITGDKILKAKFKSMSPNKRIEFKKNIVKFK